MSENTRGTVAIANIEAFIGKSVDCTRRMFHHYPLTFDKIGENYYYIDRLGTMIHFDKGDAIRFDCVFDALQSFEYGGYYFIPYRQFRKDEIERHLEGDSRPWKTDAQYALRNMRTDFALGLFADKDRPHRKRDYSYEDFYAASTDKECDIFKCVETGRLYVPGASELFSYTEIPKDKGAR